MVPDGFQRQVKLISNNAANSKDNRRQTESNSRQRDRQTRVSTRGADKGRKKRGEDSRERQQQQQ